MHENGNGNGGGGKISFYAPGSFPGSKPSVPPIFQCLKRPKEAMEIDTQLRDAASSKELWRLISASASRFDVGNVVVAFTCAAKVDEGEVALGFGLLALVERLMAALDQLEPRGLSMTAYSAAKLGFGDPRLLTQLALQSCRKAKSFGATDVAKATWAFAKLRFVEEEPAQQFWRAMAAPALATLKGGARFVDVSMTAWAFASSGWASDELMAEVASETRRALPELPPRSLAGIAWALARADFRDAELFRAMARRAAAQLAEFSAHDAASFCWAFSVAEMAEEQRQLFEELAGQLDQRGALRRLSCPLAAELAWALAAAKVEAPGAFATLEELCVSNIEMLETEDVCGFAWAFASKTARPSTWRKLAEYAERYTGRLREHEVKVLLRRHVLTRLDE
ncbi:unnamed protein product [Effrenium voratum]|nr:unnamed protein product [Effrenium voratum]